MGGFIPSVHPVANPRHRYYYSSIILSVYYKPLQFTPPIFNNIDAHKERATPQRYSALGIHPKESRDSTYHYNQQDFPPEVSNPN